MTAAEIAPRVNETARMLRIDHVLDHLPKALSQGQKQRTALARSLVGRPSVVLLDDPLRNVDAKIRYEMRFELPRVSAPLRVDRHLRDAGLQGGDGARRPRRGAGGRRLRPGMRAPHEVYDLPGTTRIARLFGDPPINLLPVSPVTGRRAGSR